MEIWLDTTDLTTIADAESLGILHGVTTNPTLIAQSGMSVEDVLEKMLDAQSGLIAVQVVADTEKEMIRQAELITAHTTRVIIKVPMCAAGLRAIFYLSAKHIPVMATAIFEPYQALLAFKAGAHYIAPYVGRMAEQGMDIRKVLEMMHTFQKNYSFEGKILAAAVRDLQTICLCATIGIDAVTIRKSLFEQFVAENVATATAIATFTKEWEKAPSSRWIPRSVCS